MSNQIKGVEIVTTAGGWKGMKDVSWSELRNILADKLGIKPRNHIDLYGFTEALFFTSNLPGDKNPDLKRVPKQGFVYVVDEDYFLETGKVRPLKENDSEGLAVFIDPLNEDYPGAILTDDIVKKTGGEYGEDVRIEYIGRSSM